jgi:hypothetical protein
MKPAKILPRLALLAVLAAPALAAAQPAPPPPPPGQPPPSADEGKARFQRGVQLFKEGDFRSALVEFRRAYDLSHNFKVLYNIGQTEFEIADYASAQRSFQRYLGEGGAEIDGARRAQVEEDLKKLAARVAKIQITSNVEGAEVLVDDVPVGKTPLAEPVLVSIGRRKVTLLKGGVMSPARFVDLAGGDVGSVAIELAEPKPGPVVDPHPLPPPPPAPPPSRTGLWVCVGVTGALVAGTAVTGGLALGAHSDAQDKLNTFGAKAADVEAAHAKASKLALAADIFGGAAIAMGVVSVVVGVTGGKADARRDGSAGSFLGRFTFGPRGAGFVGSF